MDDHKLQIILAARDATKSAFMSATGHVKAFTKNIFSMRGALVGIAGATGMGLFVKKALESADAIGKASDVIGISTDALQEYRHAARIAGVSTELMDNSFKAFSKRVGEARNETGALVTFLKKFDEQLLKDIQTAGSTEEALNLFMDRMGRTADQTDRAALAAAAFSRSGLVLTNMVKDGAAGLNRMRQEARDLGIVMDEQLIRESERANDELEKLTRVLKVQFMSAAIGLAPEIAKLAQHTTDWWKANQGLVKTDVAAYAEKIKRTIIEIKDVYDAMPAGVIGPAGAGLIGTILLGPVGGVTVGLITAAVQDLSRLKKELADIYGSAKRYLTGDVLFRGAGVTGSWGAPESAPVPMAEITNTIGKITPINVEGLAEYQQLMKEVTAAQDEFQKSLVLSGGTGEIMANQLRRGVGDTLTAFTEGYSVMENLSQRTAEAMEDNFSGFFKDVFRGELDDAGDYFRAFCYSLTDSFSDMLGQMTKELLFGKGSGGGGLFSALSGGISSLFGGGGSAGYNAADWANTLWAKGGVFKDGQVQAFARGAIINRPTLFPMARGAGLMGEAGPEGVLPLSRTSSGDLGVKAVGGSGGDTYNVSIYAIDSKSFVETMGRNPGAVLMTVNRALEKNPSARHKLKRLTA